MIKKTKLNIYSTKYKIIPNFLNKREIKFYLNSLSKEIKTIHKDYFFHLSYKKFLNTKFTGYGNDLLKEGTFGEDRLMRILSYRFFNEKKFSMLKKKVDKDALIGPNFYVFYIKKNKKVHNEHKCLLDTQPHFDFVYSLYSKTYWVPLTDTNGETGTILLPKNKKLIKKFKPYRNFRNRYNGSKYVRNAKKLDPFIKKNAKQLPLRKGNALTFGSEILHGSFKGTSSEALRINLVFRIHFRKDLYRSDPVTIRFIEEYNNNIEVFNFLNLLNLGDYKYCERAIRRNKKLLKYKNYLNSLKSKKYFNLIKSQAFLNWYDEYVFVKYNTYKKK